MANEYDNFAPKTTAFIRGKLDFGRLITPYEGASLDADNKRRIAVGKREITAPHRSITLKNASVTWKRGNPLEAFIENEKLWMSKKAENASSNPYFQLDPKGTLMPLFYQLNGDRYEEFVPENELDSDLDITVEVEVYKSKNGNGIGLRAVYVNEPVRYYVRSNNELKDLGVVVVPMSREQRDAEREALINKLNAENAAAQTAQPAPAEPAAAPYTAPATAPAPYQPPYQNYQQPTAPYQGYQQPAAPANGFQQPPVNPTGAGISWGENEQ